MPRPPALDALLADITTLEVDAIVNAANAGLAGGGGVDGAIHRAAGAEALHDACRALGGCEPGDAQATPGFALHARWIVHTVGPVWRGGGSGEDRVLASCYRRAVTVADELGARSLAFPAISTGVYGYPPERAATIAVQTLAALTTHHLDRITLAAFDQRTLTLYEHLLADTAPADRPRSSG